MQKLKQYWAIILLVVIVLGSAFYWYGLRPIPIRKKCTETAWDKAKEKNIKLDNADAALVYYKMCITGEGLSD